jgi:hypothetical protein
MNARVKSEEPDTKKEQQQLATSLLERDQRFEYEPNLVGQSSKKESEREKLTRQARVESIPASPDNRPK